MTITHNSSSEDILKIIEAIQYKVGELDIDDEDKRKIGNYLDNVKIDLKKKDPDKNSIGESIKKTNDILKEAKATGKTLKEIGVWVGKTATWLGTTAGELGWIF